MTLFICKGGLENIVVLKSILKCFELASGLKINFHKSYIGGLGFQESWLSTYLDIFNFIILRLPLIYLGITI